MRSQYRALQQTSAKVNDSDDRRDRQADRPATAPARRCSAIDALHACHARPTPAAAVAGLRRSGSSRHARRCRHGPPPGQAQRMRQAEPPPATPRTHRAALCVRGARRRGDSGRGWRNPCVHRVAAGSARRSARPRSWSSTNSRQSMLASKRRLPMLLPIDTCSAACCWLSACTSWLDAVGRRRTSHCSIQCRGIAQRRAGHLQRRAISSATKAPTAAVASAPCRPRRAPGSSDSRFSRLR